MARVKGAMMTRKHRNKVLGLAKGYWGNKSRHYKMANEQLMKSGRYAYVGRKQKKRDFRKLWITRISAGCKMNGMNYSSFMHGLKLAGIDVGDFNTKLKNAQKFLADGNRVKVSVRFRGREMAHTDIGKDLLVRFAEQCAEVATLDKEPKLEGRSMSIFLSPKTGK